MMRRRHGSTTAGNARRAVAVGVFIALGLMPALLAGCAGPRTGGGSTPLSRGGAPDTAARSAIRQMAGVFAVTLDRRETLAQADAGPAAAGALVQARQVWRIVEDSASRMVLEGLLLVGEPPVVARLGTLTFRATPADVLTFEPGHTWRVQPVSRETAWTLRVADADGRPLYELPGRWTIEPDAARFEPSATVLQPSPRDEPRAGPVAWRRGTTRLIVSDAGWRSVGDVTKLNGNGEIVAYELETRTGRRVGDASSAANDWASLYGSAWASVADVWDAWLTRGGWTITDDGNRPPLWRGVFAIVDEPMPEADRRARLARLLETYLDALP